MPKRTQPHAPPRDPSATRGIDRRSFAAASAGAAAAALLPLPACRKPAAVSFGREPGFTPRLLGLEQALMLEDLVELIIPESSTPGAKRAGVASFVESTLLDVYEDDRREQFLTGLDALNATAQTTHARSFPLCTPEQQSALLTELKTRAAAGGATPAASEAPSSFYAALRELTIVGFCNSRFGATLALRYEAVPGAYEPCLPLDAVGRAWATE
jgi:glucoside 3-dehydrogenase (cytochrome c) hitch-hiker subunit